MAYALIASAKGVGTTGAIDTTGADFIAVVVGGQTGGTVSDSKSNTWTGLTETSSGGQYGCRISYVRAPSVGGSHTFTTSVGFNAILAAAFSGSVASPFDQENGHLQLGGTTNLSGSVTPSEDNELIISGIGTGDAAVLHTIDAGFTVAQQVNSVVGVNYGGGIAYLIQTTAGAANPTWSWTSATNSSARNATFKDTVSASSVGPLTGGGSLMHGRLLHGGRLVWLPERFAA